MKYLLITYICIFLVFGADGQCNPTHHIFDGPFVTAPLSAGSHDPTDYTEEDLCDDDYGWVLIWTDEFNDIPGMPGKLDPNKWQAAYCNSNVSTGGNECATFNESPGYVVSNGILSLTSVFDYNNLNTISPSMSTTRQFPAGKVDVRALLPPIPDVTEDIAPLWMRTTLDYTGAGSSNPAVELYYANEIDVEFFQGSRTEGQFTLHTMDDDPSIGEVSYSDDNGLRHQGACTGNIADGNWHIYEIEWDMYHVTWSVDGTIVRTLARTYTPIFLCCNNVPIIPVPLYLDVVDECDGAPDNGVYDKDFMFPLYSNMPVLIGGLGNFGSTNGVHNQIPSTSLPYTEQIDYVHVYRKLNCQKNLTLPPADLNPTGGYRSAGGVGCSGNGGDQVPPTIINQTPSVLTGGSITVGKADGSVPYIFRRDDYDYLTAQNLDLVASSSITLLPGFETDLLYQSNGPCGTQVVTWSCGTPTNPETCSQALGNNWTIPDVFSGSIVPCPVSEGIKPPRVTHTSDRPEPIISNFNLSLYPNPAISQCTVQFSIPADADVTIILTDIMGRDVATIDHSWHSMGTSLVPFSTESYAPGVYTVRFSDGTNTSTQRLTITGK